MRRISIGFMGRGIIQDIKDIMAIIQAQGQDIIKEIQGTTTKVTISEVEEAPDRQEVITEVFTVKVTDPATLIVVITMARTPADNIIHQGTLIIGKTIIFQTIITAIK